MKKRVFTLFAGLSMAMTVLLSGCAAQAAKETSAPQPSSEAAAEEQKTGTVETGNYVYSYEEEIEGQNVKCSDYIILLDDATGFVSAQDIVGLHWTEDEINCDDGTFMKIKSGGDGSLIVSSNGQETVYQRTYEDLPQDLEERIWKSLTGRDYTGTYLGADSGNRIELVRRSNGLYDISVSLKDICEMQGNGNLVDGGVEIDFTDPDGNHIYAVFFPDMEKYILRITQSDYAQIPAQTDFADFIKQ